MSPAGQDEGYVTFAIPGGTDPAGGIADDTRMGVPEDVPPHWLTWFAVDDTDTAAAAVASLGGRVMVAPADSPVGRDRPRPGQGVAPCRRVRPHTS